MKTSTRRNFIKSGTMASLGSVVGMKGALARNALGADTAQGSLPPPNQAAKPGKSKRDLIMAKQAVPWKVLVEHVTQDAESVCRGMENITLELLNFVQAAARLGVDGCYACTQGDETNRVADRALFNRVIKNYDMLLYKEVAQWVPYNILHVCDYDGPYEEFDLRFQDYPGQVVNVPLMADGKPLSLRQAADIFKRPIMGGLDRHGILREDHGHPGGACLRLPNGLKINNKPHYE
jgi:hypothetical protein